MSVCEYYQSLYTREFCKNVKTRYFTSWFYKCETWSFSLREEHEGRGFEKGRLGTIFGPEGGDVPEGLRK
jgi:hypothetical protein